MRKIRSVEVLTGGKITAYTVGHQVNGLTIAEIRDFSEEYPDKRDSYYQCRDESGQPIVAIDNCPVIVEYMEVVENK